MKTTLLLATLLGCLAVSAALEARGEEVKNEGLGLIDVIQEIGDKIKDKFNDGNQLSVIEAAKKNGHDTLVTIGELKLDWLLKAFGGNIETAGVVFVREYLPELLENAAQLAVLGGDAVEIAADAIMANLRKLKSVALRQAAKYIKENKEKIGEKLAELLLSEIKNIGYEVATFGFYDTAIEYLKEKIAVLMTLAYKKAVLLAEKIVYILETYGVPALHKALEYIYQIQCDLGEMVYTMLFSKINAALGISSYGPRPDYEGAVILPYEVQTFGMLETAEEYIEDAIKRMARAGYDAAVYIIDKMIAFLKVLGLGALQLAEKIVEANKCLIGAYIYGYAMDKVKSAIKLAIISGTIG